MIMIYERLNQLERGCHDLPSLNLAQGADPFVTPLCLTSKLTWFRVSKLKHSDTVFAININSFCFYIFTLLFGCRRHFVTPLKPVYRRRFKSRNANTRSTDA